MFELIGSLVEAVAGYTAAFIAKDGKISKKRILYISIFTGLIFLIGYSFYNLFEKENDWFIQLSVFSLIISMITYAVIYLLAMIFRKR
ncbi:hypothetical protein ACWB3A_09785 [Acinetobacter baumannii]|uniref:hypothetical protein n=1 Tax=Acinetobacter baumannii TaxID=470 RepID=UPI00124916FA|nr:hypothetical protein [Acinetobacter baumannii]MCR0012454.1 hypothetical protein [Acinetobacter baumannii]MDN8172991.1 hypothetical protein [Acinetobacter baumannii]MDQ8939251.1 hypothetical protein [Acinetobacter baumannii]MDQ9850856.1 hypothetical protein [Acinetobacter baumannii]MDQ9999299.1 hypothetical protein [Acinetobacter baumannii]